MSPKFWIALGAALAGIAVAAGAMGAHALATRLDEQQLKNFETAVRYQMFHSLGLILVGILATLYPSSRWTIPGSLFLAGIVLFSGGLYAWLATSVKPFVHVVPIGGVFWILGWIALAAVAATRP